MSGTGRAVGVAVIVAAAMLWGTTGTVQALLPPERQPLIVAAVRLGLGAAFLVLLSLLDRDARRSFGSLPAQTAIGAGLAIGTYNLLFFWAVLESGVGVGTAIAIGSAPVWVTAYEIVVKGRLPDAVRAFGQALSIAGASLLVIAGRAEAGTVLGTVLAVFAGGAYATYSLLTSRVRERVPSTTMAAATFTVAAVAVLPVFLVVPSGWVTAPQAWPALVFLGVCATGVSYALYTWGLRRVAASTAVTLALIEPLTAWGLATLVLGEPLSARKILGAVMLFVGLAVVVAPPRSIRPSLQGP